MGIRRVVTGHLDGKAVFTSDAEVEPIAMRTLPQSEYHLMWGADEARSFPDDGRRPDTPRYFPPVGGFRFGFFTIPPVDAPPLAEGATIEDVVTEFESLLPGMLEHLELDDPGMHTTATIDYGVVISGEATLELDDGATTVLRPGDCYVQNGTRHRWSNAGTSPAVLAVAIVGAEHEGVPGPASP